MKKKNKLQKVQKIVVRYRKQMAIINRQYAGVKLAAASAFEKSCAAERNMRSVARLF